VHTSLFDADLAARVAASAAVADDAVAALGVPRERIHVVPRGRSRAALGALAAWSIERRAGAREALGLAPTRPVVVNVARQEPQKGQRHLLEAVAAVRRSHPDVVLLMVGREGRSTPELRRTAARLGIEEAVWWLGVRHDVSDVLCAGDVFAFPSLWEGLGGAVLEAMALRVPIVASDIPALREVLAGGRAGELVPAGDVSALAEQIVAALAGGPADTAKVDAAERRFDETYELAAVAQQMCRLYDHVLASS
jgi:glycosyltransferase involved in cell wall biosynthesis